MFRKEVVFRVSLQLWHFVTCDSRTLDWSLSFIDMENETKRALNALSFPFQIVFNRSFRLVNARHVLYLTENATNDQ